MKGFIIYPTYRVMNGKSYVFLYGKLENNKSFLTINEFQPYFFIKSKDIKKAKRLGSFESKETKLTNFNKEPVTKIILKQPRDLPELRDEFKDSKIEVYEADIRFPTRFLIDNNIQGSIEINGEYNLGNEYVDVIFQEPELKPSDYIPNNLKILSLDIETSKHTNKLYCIGLYSKNYQKSLVISKTKVPNAVSCDDEEELLEKFQNEVLDFDPDILTGWSVIDFDFDFLKKKFTRHKIPFQLSRDNSISKVKIQNSFFRSSKADFVGRMVLDGLDLIRDQTVRPLFKFPDYKLNTVAKEILGKTKIIEATGSEKYDEIDNLFKNNKKKLVDYNLLDAKLAYDIVIKSKIIELTIKRSLLTGMPLDRVGASIASLDFLYLQKARSRNLVVPTASYQEKERPITGGYVQDSEPGIYDNAIILDFKSLYPSIMRTFNIDPSSLLDKPKKDSIKSPNKAYFEYKEGILPEIINELWKEREQARKNKDELTRYAIKILMNSFFGVLASPSCRFFNMKIANAITTFGQQFNKDTSKLIEDKGYNVIYGDTDSIFVDSKLKSDKEATKIGLKLEKEINNYYDKQIKKEFNKKSFLELEFEKCYLRLLMPKIRGGEKGAKKRYAGLIKNNGKEEMQFVGLEVARSDWTEAAKEFQTKLLDLIFHKKEVSTFIKDYVDRLRSGKLDEKLIYKKSLRKGVEGYAVNPPHLKAAKKIKGPIPKQIEYYMTTDGPEPIQNLKHNIDYEHYIKKQIKPLSDAVLDFYNVTFEEIISGKKQTTLFSFS